MTVTRRKFLIAAGAVGGGVAIAAVDVFGLPGSRAGASGLPDMIVTSVSHAGGTNTYDSLISSLAPSLWLKLDETSGTTAADSSGNGFDGTYSTSGVTRTANTAAGAGNDAGAVGLSTGTISVPNDPSFTNLTTTSGTHWSALMWVQLGTGYGSYPWLMGVGDGGTGSGSTGWQMFGSKTLAFKAGNTQTNEDIPSPLTTLALVGVVWDGVRCQIWENGVNSFSESETLGATVTDTTSPLIIGPTLGIVNQVMIFPTALSAAQMASIHSEYTSPGTTAGSTTVASGITAGDVVYFSATVKNKGTAPTPAGIVNSVAFRVDKVEVSWSGTDTTSLAAGASTTLKADRGGAAQDGSWIATAGSHTLIADVNDVGRFPESNTTNNALSVAFTVAAKAAAPPVTKPVNTSPPTISGTPTVGSKLTVSPGTWS